MRNILKHRGLRLVFAANMISMLGSGMNSAAVTWYVLQATHSEMALGTLLMLQTIPVLLMLPFSGVVIDRHDRRRLVMALDAVRGAAILVVAALALRGQAKIWEVYCMSILVAAGFWMFWPTITALIQELSPESEFVHANSFLMVGVQSGWLMAGSLVGFVYNSIGLGGVLLIDFATYALSFTCYLFVRKGRHIVAEHSGPQSQGGDMELFFAELREGIAYIRLRPRLLFTGCAWAFFIGAMLTQGVITAPFSDRILKTGAVGYGWLNGGWAVGALLGAFYTPALIRGAGHRRTVGFAMAVLGLSLIVLPFLGLHVRGTIQVAASSAIGIALLACVPVYIVMGCCRAVGGVAITSAVMEMVPKHFMGRVQNTFYFAGTALQLVLAFLVGAISHTRSLAAGFALVGSIYLMACLIGSWPTENSGNASMTAAPVIPEGLPHPAPSEEILEV